MFASIVPFWLLVTLGLSQGQRSQLQPRVVGDRRSAGRLDANAFQTFNFGTPGVNQRAGPASAWSRSAQSAQVPVMPIDDTFHNPVVATGDSDWDSVVGQPIPRLDTRPVINTGPDVGFVPNNFRGRGCDKRIRVINGATRIRDRGTLARFQCSYGFHMLGASVAVCVQGKWSDPPPLCVRDGCRKLTIPIHGTLRMLYGGAVGIFTCNYGYKVEGERVLMCDGQQWNGTAPYCSEIPPVVFEPPTTTTLPPTRPPAIEQPTTVQPEMPPIDIATPTPEPFTTTIEISEVEVQNNLVEQETTTDSVVQSVEATSTPAPTPPTTQAKNDDAKVATESTIAQITTPTISSTSSTLRTVETTLSVLIPEQPVLDNETDQSTTTTQMTNEVQQVGIPKQTIPPNTKMATTTSAPEVLDAPTTETTLSSVSDEIEIQLPQILTHDDSTVTAETHDQMSTAPPEVSNDQLTSTETSNTGQAVSPVSSTNDVSSTDYSSILQLEPESDIVTVPSQPISEEESVIFHEEPPVTAVTVDNGPTVAVTSKVNVLAETSTLPDTAQTQFQQEFDFSHENSRIREYVAISPSKLDVDSGHSGHHWAVGQLLVIAGTALVTIGCVTIAAVLLMYCWRRNKGIARPRRNDTDGRTLSFHEGTDELIWYDPRTGEGELTRL